MLKFEGKKRAELKRRLLGLDSWLDDAVWSLAPGRLARLGFGLRRLRPFSGARLAALGRRAASRRR